MIARIELVVLHFNDVIDTRHAKTKDNVPR